MNKGRGLKRVLDSLELELQVIVSCVRYVGDGFPSLVLIIE